MSVRALAWRAVSHPCPTPCAGSSPAGGDMEIATATAQAGRTATPAPLTNLSVLVWPRINQTYRKGRRKIELAWEVALQLRSMTPPCRAPLLQISCVPKPRDLQTGRNLLCCWRFTGTLIFPLGSLPTAWVLPPPRHPHHMCKSQSAAKQLKASPAALT